MEITLEKLNEEIQEIKLELIKISHFLKEDFELSKEVKEELEKARKEPISKYIDNKEVLKEFT
jgi:hypothetical protein